MRHFRALDHRNKLYKYEVNASFSIRLAISCSHLAISCSHLAISCSHLAISCSHLAISCSHLAISCSHLAISCSHLAISCSHLAISCSHLAISCRLLNFVPFCRWLWLKTDLIGNFFKIVLQLFIQILLKVPMNMLPIVPIETFSTTVLNNNTI